MGPAVWGDGGRSSHLQGGKGALTGVKREDLGRYMGVQACHSVGSAAHTEFGHDGAKLHRDIFVVVGGDIEGGGHEGGTGAGSGSWGGAGRYASIVAVPVHKRGPRLWSFHLAAEVRLGSPSQGWAVGASGVAVTARPPAPPEHPPPWPPAFACAVQFPIAGECHRPWAHRETHRGTAQAFSRLHFPSPASTHDALRHVDVSTAALVRPRNLLPTLPARISLTTAPLIRRINCSQPDGTLERLSSVARQRWTILLRAGDSGSFAFCAM